MTKINIFNNEFEVPDLYAEGHVCTDLEAKQLNRCLAENVGNNQRKFIKEAIEKDGNVSSEVMATFNEYAAAYRFTEASVGSRRSTMTPVEKEAKKIATARVNKHLADTGRKKADVDRDKYDEQVALLAASEKVQKIARRRVKEMDELTELEVE